MPYKRWFSKRQKFVRSWKLYWLIVTITFVVAFVLSECMAHAGKTVVICNLYVRAVIFDDDGASHLTNKHFGELIIKIPDSYSDEEKKIIILKEILKVYDTCPKCSFTEPKCDVRHEAEL